MNSHDQNAALIKMGIGGALATFAGLTLNEWAAVVAIAYGLAQLVLLIPKYIQVYRNWKNPPRNRRASDRDEG